MDVQAVGYNERVLNQKRALVNLNDKEIRTLAYMATHENKNKMSPTNKALCALPVVSGVAASVLTKGSLATRIGAGLLRGAGWAAPLAIFGVYNKAEDAIVGNSSKLRKFRDKNPLTYALASAGAFLGALAFSYKKVGKFVNTLFRKVDLAKHAQAMGKEIPAVIKKSKIGHALVNWTIKGQAQLQKMGAAIDNSIFNTKGLPKLENASAWLGEKMPIVKSALKSVLNWSSWVLIGGGMLKSVNQAQQKANQTTEAYMVLKDAQAQVAQELAEIDKKPAEKPASVEEAKESEKEED